MEKGGREKKEFDKAKAGKIVRRVLKIVGIIVVLPLIALIHS